MSRRFIAIAASAACLIVQPAHAQENAPRMEITRKAKAKKIFLGVEEQKK